MPLGRGNAATSLTAPLNDLDPPALGQRTRLWLRVAQASHLTAGNTLVPQAFDVDDLIGRARCQLHAKMPSRAVGGLS